MFTDVYTKPEFYLRWVRKVAMWEVRVRHYKPLAEAALDLADVITGDAAPLIETIPWQELNREDAGAEGEAEEAQYCTLEDLESFHK